MSENDVNNDSTNANTQHAAKITFADFTKIELRVAKVLEEQAAGSADFTTVQRR